MLADRALPPAFPHSDLFERFGGDALKLYLWLRARARLVPAAHQDEAYLEAEATGAEIERAIGVSKNTVTKLARELQALGVASFEGSRTGYCFRLGERCSRPAGVDGLTLAAEVFYLDAWLASSPRQEGYGG